MVYGHVGAISIFDLRGYTYLKETDSWGGLFHIIYCRIVGSNVFYVLPFYL